MKNFNSFYKEYVYPILEKDKRDLYLEFLKKNKPPFFVNYEKFDEFNNIQELRYKYSDEELFNFLSDKVKEKCEAYLKRVGYNMNIEVLIFSNEYGELGRSKNFYE